jgi:hypothetical protein
MKTPLQMQRGFVFSGLINIYDVTINFNDANAQLKIPSALQ